MALLENYKKRATRIMCTVLLCDEFTDLFLNQKNISPVTSSASTDIFTLL